MQLPQSGQIVNIQAYKQDGTLYRQWNGVKVLESSPEVVVALMYKTKVAEATGQKWIVREPIIWFFPTQEWFNTTALIRKSGTYFYTNMSSSPLFEDNTIKFIDYDLDIKAYPESAIKLVDKSEFEKHKVLFNYSDKLVEIINRTSAQVIKYIQLGDGYFSEDVIDQYVKELVDSKQLSIKTGNEIRE